MFPPFLRFSRFEWGVVLLHLLFGIGCSFVPLLRALEYPLSLVLSLFSSLVFAAAATRVTRTRPFGHAVTVLGVLVVISATAAIVPVAIASLAASAVCEPAYGLLFIVLGPMCSACMAAVFGVAVGRLVKRPLLSAVVAMAAVVLSLLVPVAEFFWTPGVRFYGTFFGLYHGAVYDEAVFVEMPYVWLRLWNLAAVLAVLFAVGLVGPRRWLSAVFACAWVVLLVVSPRLGFVSSYIPLHSTLSSTLEAPGIVVHTAPGGRAEEVASHLARDLAFRSRQIDKLFGLPAREADIHVYLYDSPAQKARLMGAGRTSIAKPWLGELHIQTHEVGDTLVAHELAHVMLAGHADSLLGVPVTWGFIPRPGIIEGAAVAVERGEGLLTVHQWARAMRDIDKMPDMEVILEGLGFWRQSGSLAYTACGSFVRFLLDARGAKPFAALYRGATLEEAYGEPLAGLLASWNLFLDSVTVADNDLELARFVFSRKAVFDRACPYAGARCLVRGAHAARGGRPEVIYRMGLQAMTMTGGQFSLRSRFARLALAWGRPEDALNIMTFLGQGAEETLSLTAQSSRDVLVADVLWLAGEDEQAHAAYARLSSGPAADWLGSGLQLRHLLSARPTHVQFKRLLTGSYVRSQRHELLKPPVLLHENKALSLLEQLALGLVLTARPTTWDLAAQMLSASLNSDLQLPQTLAHEARFRLALALITLGRFKQAANVLAQFDATTLSPAEFERLADLLARLAQAP